MAKLDPFDIIDNINTVDMDKVYKEFGPHVRVGKAGQLYEEVFMRIFKGRRVVFVPWNQKDKSDYSNFGRKFAYVTFVKNDKLYSEYFCTICRTRQTCKGNPPAWPEERFCSDKCRVLNALRRS